MNAFRPVVCFAGIATCQAVRHFISRRSYRHDKQ